MMKKTLLFVLALCVSTIIGYSQTINASDLDDLCTDANTSVEQVNGTSTYTLDISAGTFTDDTGQSPTACGITDVEDVFFAFDVANTGAYTINVSSSGSFCAEIGDDCTTLEEVSPDCIILEAGTTYILAIYFAAGDIDDVTVDFTDDTAANDQCDDAEVITGGNTSSTNECSTSDNDPALVCNGDPIPSVWFSYTVPADTYEIRISVINGTMVGNPILAVLNDACNVYYNPPMAGTAADSESCDGSAITILCPMEGDIIKIFVASEEGNEGTFDLDIKETSKDPSCTANDECDDATVIDMTGLDCTMPETLTGECNNTSCAESFTAAGCPWGDFGTVWYEIQTDPDATTLDIEVLAGSMPNPNWTLTDTPCGTAPTTVAGVNLCENALVEDIVITGGTSYYLLVADQNGTDGTFDIEITQNIPPMGDEPCDSNGNANDDFIDLGTGGTAATTTCCAVGSNDDNTLDMANQECSGASDDDAVWFSVEIDFDMDGLEVVVDGSGSFTVEVYNGGANAGCAGMDSVEGSSCSASGFHEVNVTICEGLNTHFWIKVSSSEANCGDVSVRANQVTGCDHNDVCEDSAGADFEPVTNLNGDLDFICLQGCMEYACPEGISNCGFNDMPVVWFQVTTDADAAQIFANVEVQGGSWSPVFAIFEGDCPNQVPVSTADSPECNTAWPIQDQINQPVQTSINTYWVAVGADGDAQDIIDNPDFEVCVATTVVLIVCLGDFGGSCDDETDWELMDSDIEDQDLGAIDELAPPTLCQGEMIEVCGEFTYDASETGVDWLIGVVPIFGEGWNLVDFDPSTAEFNGNGMQAQWYDDEDANAPILQEYVSTLCTYTDAAGNLQLCNALCGPCPCSPGIPMDTPLPGGWFWVTQGGNAECDNDGSPGEGWGIGTTVVAIDFCFEIQVRDDFADAAECNQADLTIGFQTFSDGVAGCWEDPVGECLLDEAQVFEFDIQCELPPEVYVEGLPCQDFVCFKDICHKSEVDADLSLADGSTIDLEVTFDANGTPVTGGNDHVFPGFGTIDDVLCNPTNVPQTVIYELSSNDPDIICPGPTTYLEVTVYPEILYMLEEFETCENGDDLLICVDPVGGTGNYSYVWSNGVGDTECWPLPQPLVPANPATDPAYTYFVIVTDDLGCTGSIDVEVVVHPEVLFELEPLNLCLTTDQSMCEYIIDLPTIENGTPGYDYYWSISPSTGIQYDVNNSDQLVIDLCNSFDGQFNVTLEVEDFHGCFKEMDFELELAATPVVNITQLTNPCDDGTGTQQYDLNVQSSFPFPIIELFDEAGNSVAGPTAATGDDDFSVIGAGTYTFVLTEIVAGCINEQEFLIDPPAATIPEISADPNPICLGDATTIMVDNSNAFIGGSFVWSDTDMSTGSSITTDTISGNTTYVVTATDSDGCSATGSIEIMVNPLPVAGISGSLSYCVNSSTTLTGSGGETYEWTLPGGGTSAMNPLMVSMPGMYVLEVTDTNGCKSTTSVDVVEDANLNPQIVGGDICDNGSVELDAGSGFDSYSWSGPNGALGSMQTELVSAGGTYTVLVEDGSGCTGTGTFTVNVFQTPVVNATTMDICNSDETGASTMFDLASLYPGISGDYFDPSGVIMNNTEIDADGLAVQTQTYTFTTNTATLPCMDATAQITINIVECICPLVAVDPGTELCSSDSPYNLLNLEQAAVADGFWSYNGDVLMGDLFDPSIGAGTYEVIFTLDPANQGAPNCPATDTAEIVVQQAVIIENDMSAVACNTDQSGGVTFINLDDYFTNSDAGEWTDVNGMVISGTIDYDGDAEGTLYTYTYTTTGAVAPCDNESATLTVEVTDCSCPPVSVDPGATLCTSDVAFDLSTLEQPNIADGNWSYDGSILAGDLFDPSIGAGTYDVVFTLNPANQGAPSCDPTDTAQIVVNQAVTIEMDMGPFDACNTDESGGDTTIDLNDYFTNSDAGEWTDANGVVISGEIDYDGDAVGTIYVYTYTTTGAVSPCVNMSSTLTIEVIDCTTPPCPDPMLTNPSTACNDNDMVDLNTTIGDPTVTGFWQDADGNQISNIIDVTQLGIGTVDFTYVLDPAPDPICDQTFPLTLDVISQNNPGEADPDILHICEDDIEIIQLPSLIDPASDPDVGGVWQDDPANDYNGSPFDPNGGSFDPGDQDPGTYIFTYGWYNNPPCDDVWTTITIVIDPNPVADAGMGGELNCNNSETGILLDGSGSTGTQPLSFLWSEMTNSVTIEDPTAESITVTEPGIYVLEITDNNECIDSDQVEVTTDPNLPTMSVESTSPDCVGDAPGTITIAQIVGGTEPYEFSIDGGQTWTDQLVFNNVPAGDYTVTLQDANGCRFNAFATITPEANPNVELPSTATISLGDSYVLNPVLNFIPDDVGNMVWTEDGIEIYNGDYLSELEVTPDSVAVEYCVFITDVNGCTTEACITVRTQQISSVYLANIISTDPSSGNKSFFVQSPYVEAVTTFSIYDRWGELIFSIDEETEANIAENGWSGTFKDKRVTEGVYVYYIEVRYIEGVTPSTESFTGTITVIH